MGHFVKHFVTIVINLIIGCTKNYIHARTQPLIIVLEILKKKMAEITLKNCLKIRQKMLRLQKYWQIAIARVRFSQAHLTNMQIKLKFTKSF